MCPAGASPGVSGSSATLQPDLPEWDVRIAKAIHLDAPDIGLEEPLVRVVVDRHDRRVVEDHLLGFPVQLDPPLQIAHAPSARELIVHDWVRVPEEVARAPRVKELGEEIIWIRDIGMPGVQEDGQHPFVEHLRERRPICEVVDFRDNPDRRERLLDLLVLTDDIVPLHARPDRDGWQTTPPGVARVGEKPTGLVRIIRGSYDPRVEAESARGEDSARKNVLAEVHILNDGLTVDGVDDGLAYAPVVESLGPSVEPVEAHANRRTLHVDVAVIRGQRSAVGAGRPPSGPAGAPPGLRIHDGAPGARGECVDGTGGPGRAVEGIWGCAQDERP